ncbi:putative ribosomal protein L17 [Gregarina niphandrodes]|uniref:Ribosomal protein L17 n=1 Tax=Gregarina niphandrodes TaxID=110365 RepID=A0A023B9J2_GRENI|nr:putative ribosomal protein L17 [Gregarina niphandrodes]EZG72992.1 putative ribosomal protein L17 [Gregarina niphandrodes]|eukprot:XP_011129687.1 putative ribosomal protein L17 [Gregarina niphandrodes]
MVKYIRKVNEEVDKSVCARGNDLRVSFKNTRETGAAIQGMTVEKARAYLDAVLEHKRCIPFRRFNGGVGRTAQAKEFGVVSGRWPEKSVKVFLNLLDNIEANARNKELDTSKLYIWHCAVQRAMKGRRRTYRAHGRINPFMSNPCHVELVCKLKQAPVPKPPTDSDHSVTAMANTNTRELRMAF